jgi:hypothetical protein
MMAVTDEVHDALYTVFETAVRGLVDMRPGTASIVLLELLLGVRERDVHTVCGIVRFALSHIFLPLMKLTKGDQELLGAPDVRKDVDHRWLAPNVPCKLLVCDTKSVKQSSSDRDVSTMLRVMLKVPQLTG